MHAGHVAVDAARCSGCGQCVRVCPDRTLELHEHADGGKRTRVRQERCLGCGHCQAICPEGAVTVRHDDPEATAWATFTSDDAWLPPGAFPVGDLVRLMRSRRSCRNYRPEPVPLAALEDLVRIAVTAPSGTNSQRWSFTLLPERARVVALAEGIRGFFQDLNRKAEKAWLRTLLRALGKSDLEDYWREYYHSVQGALEDWDERGEDRLFHGAPAAVLVGMLPGASCPMEDAMLATQNLLLGAHAMGLGTCLVGYAVAAMQHTPSIKDVVGIPRKEPVHAVIAVGWPAWPEDKYQRTTGRRMPMLRKG
jgi:nitroreductase/Pyruvate/2-oxoacid:ferredoxin oxidoreductase delta subunit